MLNKISIDFVCRVNMRMSTCGMCMAQEVHTKDNRFQASIPLLPHRSQESNPLWEGPLLLGHLTYSLNPKAGSENNYPGIIL